MSAVTHSPPHTRPSARSPLSSNEKIDICRGLFAFLVVAAHAVDISWAIHPEVPGRFPGWLHDFLLYVAAAGVYWVIGFFAISGYCIQLSVERQIRGNAFPLHRYLLARLSRILPLYYLALVLAVVIERLIATAAVLLAPGSERQHPDRPALHPPEPDLDLRVFRAVLEHHQRDVLLPVLRGRGVRGAPARPAPTVLGMGLCLVLALRGLLQGHAHPARRRPIVYRRR